MRLAPIQLLTLLFLFPVAAQCELSVGQVYSISFVDVDGNTLSTADGHVTAVVVTSESNLDRARAVGDRIPNFCLGKPDYRMITVLSFQKEHSKPVRMVLAALIRRRLDGEGRRLQSRYDQLKVAGNARRDVRAVADFDGTISSQFGLSATAGNFRVFVFGRSGQLLRQWNDLPSAEELAAALK